MMSLFLMVKNGHLPLEAWHFCWAGPFKLTFLLDLGNMLVNDLSKKFGSLDFNMSWKSTFYPKTKWLISLNFFKFSFLHVLAFKGHHVLSFGRTFKDRIYSESWITGL